ncbi:MAG: HAD family hydrolase, partial [Acidimicrobiia bacterium]
MAPTHWDDVRFVLCDLDGVVWLARRAIPGAIEAIERLRASGRRVLFVTNNSMSLVADQEAALAEIGIPAGGDV